MKIVLDTNCLLPAVFPRSIYHWVWESFRRGDFKLCYSNEIIAEYEEQLSNLYPPEVTKNTLYLLLASHDVEKVFPYYKWDLISAGSLCASNESGCGLEKLPQQRIRQNLRSR